MKVFEIIFILLLMIPVALLMRFLISRLSAEKPKQVRRPSDAQEVSVRALRSRRHKKKADPIKREKQKKTEEPNKKESLRPATRNMDFVPRSPVQQKRSQRVPFAEMKREPEITDKGRAGAGRKITPRQGMTIVRGSNSPDPAAGSKTVATDSKTRQKGLFSRKTVLLRTEGLKAKDQEQGARNSRSKDKPAKRQNRRRRERARKRRSSRADNNEVQ